MTKKLMELTIHDRKNQSEERELEKSVTQERLRNSLQSTEEDKILCSIKELVVTFKKGVQHTKTG